MMAALTCGAIAAAAVAVAWSVPRWAGFERGVQTAVFVTAVVRLAIGAALFALTVAGAPFLGSQIAGPGLWRALPDSLEYHKVGVQQMEAAARGVALPVPDGYTSVVGRIYVASGANPFAIILLNSLLSIVAVIALLVLGRRVTGHDPPVWLAYGLGLWPSSLAWSSQLLKDGGLFGLSALMLLVSVSILARATTPAWRRYYLSDWALLVALVVAVTLIRPAMSDVLTVATGVVAAGVAIHALWTRSHWQQAFVAAALAVVVLQSQTNLRHLLYPVTAVDAAYGYLALGEVYEREHRITDAQETYATALTTGGHDGTVAEIAQQRLDRLAGVYDGPAGELALVTGAGPQPADDPVVAGFRRVGERLTLAAVGARVAGFFTTIGHYSREFASRMTLARLARLRSANMQGASQFGSDADVSRTAGLLTLLPIGLAHTLFAPFPWMLFDREGSAGALRYFAVVELPWVYLVVVLGVAGVLASLRANVRRPEVILIAAYALIGLAALAVAVPNDGLLFRYRLQFLAPLTVFIPFALETHAVRGALARLRNLAATAPA